MNAFESFRFIHVQRESIMIARIARSIYEKMLQASGIPEHILNGAFKTSYAQTRINRLWWTP